MNEKVEIIFGLLGGLAVFIFGMNMMSECLQKAAGDKMKKILSLLTKNPLLGALAGALVTAVLQSSSATTVMAIGFVSAGLMALPQAISIILGANIGTTMTAQLIAFKLSDYIYVIIFAGFIISFVCKSERVKNIGQTIFAFGLLFLGIETMGSVMKPLASSPVFTDMIERVADIPVLGVLVGTLMTLVVQSSSATIAVLQNFASQPGLDGVTSMIGLAGAIPILLGDNIGTTITALLASIGQSKDAKRTAAAHCLFNISGCLLFIWFIKPFAVFIQWISPKGPEIEVISRQIANSHTIFNLVMTIIWIPLIGVLVKLVMWLIPDGKQAMVDPAKPLYLDDKILGQPAAALQLATRELLHCSEIVQNMMNNILNGFDECDRYALEEIGQQGHIVSSLYNSITEYLVNLFSGGFLTEQQATQAAGLMSVLGDVDKLGSLSMEIRDALYDREEKKYKYSDEATKDLKKSMKVVENMFNEALDSLAAGNVDTARRLLKGKEKLTTLDIRLRKGHMDRVKKGKCKPSLTAPFTQVLNSLNRMCNNCMNIAETAAAGVSLSYFLDETDLELIRMREEQSKLLGGNTEEPDGSLEF